MLLGIRSVSEEEECAPDLITALALASDVAGLATAVEAASKEPTQTPSQRPGS